MFRLIPRRSLSKVGVFVPRYYSALKSHSLNSPFVTPKKVHPKSFVDLAQHNDGRLNLLTKVHCSSCGVQLQADDPEKSGFHKKAEESGKEIRSPEMREVDKKYVEFLDKLSDDEKLLLVNDQTNFAEPKAFKPYTRQMYNPPKPKQFQSLIDENEQIHKRTDCLRCQQALHHNIYNKDQHDTVEVKDVMERIPPSASIVYILQASDFPLGINRDVFKYFKAKQIHFVVNKVDYFYDALKQPDNLGAKYFKKALEKLYGADPAKVFLTSGKLFWGTKTLHNKLPKGEVYFIGDVNSGKSSLIKALLYANNLSLSKRGNYGPGISFMPSFTKEFMTFPLKSGVKIIDAPGFAINEKGIYKHLSGSLLKEFNEKPHFLNPVTAAKGKKIVSKISKIGSYNGRRVMTVGGLFFLKPPENIVAKFRVMMPGKPAIYSDIKKAIDVFEKTRPEALGPIYTLEREAYSNMKRYAIPPFFGSVDVVIGNFGFITIIPTGDKSQVPKNEIFEVWAPKDVKICIREPLTKHIYKTRGQFDSYGNLLKKEEIPYKGAFEIKEIPDNKPVFSKVFELTDSNSKPAEMFADEFYKRENEDSYKTMELIDPNVESQEKYPNFYWDDQF